MVFLLNTLRRTVGSYIRGQLFMSAFIGTLVGSGMAAFQVPCALLLGILAFILEFVFILGTIASGVACVLVAFATRGLVIAALVLGYFIIVHILEGEVVGPRVMGHVLGLHPIVAILALTAGFELFGLWGRSLARRWLASARPSSFPPGPNGALPIQTNSPGRPPPHPNPTVSQNHPSPPEAGNPTSALFSR